MILVDTGPLVALANDKDDAHSACERLLTTIAGPLLVPAPVSISSAPTPTFPSVQ